MKSLLSLPALPKPGQRLDLPPLSASADALALAQLARPGRLLAVVTASPLEAQRLAEEIAWFAPGLRVHLLPDWETLPYDSFSPHQDLISERLATLYAVSRNECEVLIAAASTAVTRLAPPAFLAGHTFFMKQGERLDLDKLRAQLTLAGYQHVTQVVAAGEYSVRGGLVDLFPMGTQLPYRIELFDDEVETIRSFDVDSQRTSIRCRKSACCRRASSPPATPAAPPSASASASLRGRCLARQPLQGCLERHPAGRHRVLPAAVLRNHGDAVRLPARAHTLLLHGDVAGAIAEFWSRHAGPLQDARRRPLAAGAAARRLFLRDEEFFVAAKALPQLTLIKVGVGDTASATGALPPLAVDRKADDPLAALRGLPRRSGRPRAAAGRIARPAPDAGRLPRRVRPRPEPCADFAAFLAGADALHARRRPALRRLPAGQASPSSPRTSSTPPPPARAGAAPMPAAPTSKAGCATCPS
jgi:transcription-repair coupling factor (superfamily II helicase)